MNLTWDIAGLISILGGVAIFILRLVIRQEFEEQAKTLYLNMDRTYYPKELGIEKHKSAERRLDLLEDRFNSDERKIH